MTVVYVCACFSFLLWLKHLSCLYFFSGISWTVTRTPYNLNLINLHRKRKMSLKLEKIFSASYIFRWDVISFEKYFGCQPVKLLLWLLFCLDSFGNHWVKSPTDQLAFYAYFLSESAAWKEFRCTHFTRNQKQRTLELTRVETSFPTSHQLHVLIL